MITKRDYILSDSYFCEKHTSQRKKKQACLAVKKISIYHINKIIEEREGLEKV